LLFPRSVYKPISAMNNVKHCDYVVMPSSARLATRGAPSGGVCLSHGADTSRNWARIVFLHCWCACRQYTVFTLSLADETMHPRTRARRISCTV
jgi:hypothetical protein